MLYDVFVSHASEDKIPFVRTLAEALRSNNVAVWYDEFSLKVGDSLRRSIDQGLAKSRFGIVVLSHAFIGKQWPQWELDGLVQRQLNSPDQVILPVWLDVSYNDVLAFSPPLADKYAIRASRGLDRVVEALLEVIKPQGSSLVVARERLIRIGFDAPVVTDDWWHRAIEYCGSNPVEGTFQEAMGWGQWGFPLPAPGDTAAEKGERIAWAALQLNWQQRTEVSRVTQITNPDAIHEFIRSTPGLREACFQYPHFLAAYAPQLTLPGFGGDFEDVFDNWLAHSKANHAKEKARGSQLGRALTIDGKVPTCDEGIALHDHEFGCYEPARIACHFVQGDIMGPPVKVYEVIDYLLWLLSDASGWLPAKVRSFLVEGINQWGVWPWSGLPRDPSFSSSQTDDALLHTIMECRSEKDFRPTDAVINDINTQFGHTIRLLQLPESIDILKSRFLEGRFIEEYIREHRSTKRKKPNKALHRTVKRRR